jgi:hypothetical protein
VSRKRHGCFNTRIFHAIFRGKKHIHLELVDELQLYSDFIQELSDLSRPQWKRVDILFQVICFTLRLENVKSKKRQRS